MSGFASNDQVISALSNGQNFKQTWGKLFNPTTGAVANEFHTLFRGAGNPGADAIFDSGSNLTFQPVTDSTTSAASIQHGGNVQPTYHKHLASATAVSAALTSVPGILKLVDVIGFYRVTTVTTTTAQATTNTLGQTATFTADNTTDTLTYTSTASNPSNILTGTRVRLTTTVSLPVGLATATDYYVIRIDDLTCKLATTYANAVAGTAINFTTDGVGTHTVSWLLPRYTNGAGVQAIFFNPAATALGAATPSLSLGYTNASQVASRATPTVLPIGKTAAANSLILYTGATGTGKYNYTHPQQSGDSGIAEVNTIQNSTSYVSGTYTVALIKEITELPLSTIGLAAERNLMTEMPSFPRIYDGAALYWIYGSGAATPINSAFSGTMNFIWN